MDTEQLDVLRKRFDFDSWESSELIVRDVVLPKDVVSGFDPARLRQIDPGDGTKLLRASWSMPGEDESILVMDVRECADREAVHQVLLELLGNMQAPDVVRLTTSLGDVAFGRETEMLTAVAFARGNIVVWLRNGAEKVVSVAESALQIDGWITGGERR